MSLLVAARRIIPLGWRVELLRLKRWPKSVLDRGRFASEKAESLSAFPFTFTSHLSPLRRASVSDESLQAGKERNVALAASRIDPVLLQPGETFSYHRLVGWPSRLRGFRHGLELRNGKMSSGVGGGCCQISNLLYLLALRGGLEIVERHRHALDLFPDHGRTVPFGCGATVFYNTADLKFRNPHSFPVLIHLRIENGDLIGELKLAESVDLRIDVYEKDHQFRREEESWYRENRICRRWTTVDGQLVKDEEVVHNVGRCMYDPEAADD